MKKKYFLIFLILAISIFVGSIIYDFVQSNVIAKKIALLDLKLSGTVIKKKDFLYGHDYGFVLIDVNTSNYDNFDPRNKNEDYFFIIKKNKCVLVLSGLSEMQAGDSIVVNKNKYSLYRKNKNIFKNSDLVMLSPIYYDNPDTLFND